VAIDEMQGLMVLSHCGARAGLRLAKSGEGETSSEGGSIYSWPMSDFSFTKFT